MTISFEGDSKTYNLRPNGHITYSLKVYEKPGGKYSFKVGVGNQWKTIKFNVANSFMEWVKPQQWLLIHDVGYLKKDLLIFAILLPASSVISKIEFSESLTILSSGKTTAIFSALYPFSIN